MFTESKQQEQDSSSIPEGSKQLFQELITLVTCAYAHPIQYGEDIRLAAARGEDARVEELSDVNIDIESGNGSNPEEDVLLLLLLLYTEEALPAPT